jgi:putative transposase
LGVTGGQEEPCLTERVLYVAGNYYHVYNRGAGRSLIFFNDDNYSYCLQLIQRYRVHYGVAILAYYLMPNHYHFLLRQEGDIPLSRFINTLFNAYVQAVNRQQGRTGTIFEGRFRHVWVDREEYLVHLCRYIHLNPVEAGLIAQPEKWPYSNYLEWIGQRGGTLKDDVFMHACFLNPAAYREFVKDYGEEERMREQIRPYLME